MTDTERDSIRRRLDEAIADRRMTVNDFRRRMKGTGAKGSSYASIHSYLDPDETVTPSVEFLEAASRVLRVRPAWLILGEGEKTEVEQHAVKARRGSGVALPLTDEINAAFEDAFPSFARLNLMDQFMLWHVWRFLWNSQMKWAIDELEPPDPDLHPDDPKREPDARMLPAQIDAAGMIGRALQAPLDAMEVNAERVGNVELHRYVETACNALLFLVDREELDRAFRRGSLTRIDR